jgi:CRP/FNR family transcriptional regulator, cyclic AMP receptor protein
VTRITACSLGKRYHNLVACAVQLSCLNCGLRPDRAFCDLPPDALKAFEAIKTIALHPRGAILFNEGRPARGAFILCDGRARLTVDAGNGRQVLLRLARPGEILGLSATISGEPYEVTAELLDNSQVAFVPRKDMLNLLRNHRDLFLEVLQLLSQDLHTAYNRIRVAGHLGRNPDT